MPFASLKPIGRIVGSWQKSDIPYDDGGSTATSIVDAINDPGTTEWLNPALVSNDCLEFFSIGIDTYLPPGALVQSMRMNFAWRHDKDGPGTGAAVINCAAIDNDTGALVRGPDDSRIWYNSSKAASFDYPLDWTIRPAHYKTADGRDWSEFDVVGFTIEHVWGSGSGEQRIYEVIVETEYELGEVSATPTVSGSVTAPLGLDPGDLEVDWNYSNSVGRPQLAYEAVVAGASEALFGGTSDIIYKDITEDLDNSLVIDCELVWIENGENDYIASGYLGASHEDWFLYKSATTNQLWLSIRRSDGTSTSAYITNATLGVDVDDTLAFRVVVDWEEETVEWQWGESLGNMPNTQTDTIGNNSLTMGEGNSTRINLGNFGVGSTGGIATLIRYLRVVQDGTEVAAWPKDADWTVDGPSIESTGNGDPVGTSVVASSGKITSESARKWLVDVPLDPGLYVAMVKLYSSTAAGQEIDSGWIRSFFEIPQVPVLNGVPDPTPATPDSVTASYSAPTATVDVVLNEPRKSGFVEPALVELERSSDGTAYAPVDSKAPYSPSPLEAVILAHDPEAILLLVDDLVVANEPQEMRLGGEVQVSAAPSALLPWEGDHYVWFSGDDGNSMTRELGGFASTEVTEIYLDLESADVDTSGSRFINFAGGYAQVSNSNYTLSVFAFDGTSYPVFSANYTQLGLPNFEERFQLKCVLDYSIDECQFWKRPVSPGLLEDRGDWVLAYTDTAAAPASVGSRTSSSSSSTCIGDSTASGSVYTMEGKIYELVVRDVDNDVIDLHFYPGRDVGPVDHTNPEAGEDGWEDADGYTWYLYRESDTRTDRTTQIVTAGKWHPRPTNTSTKLRMLGAGDHLFPTTPQTDEVTLITFFTLDEPLSATSRLWSAESAGGIGPYTYGNGSENIVAKLGGLARNIVVDHEQHARAAVAVIFDTVHLYGWSTQDGEILANTVLDTETDWNADEDLVVWSNGSYNSGGGSNFAGSLAGFCAVRKALSTAELEELQDLFLAGRAIDEPVTFDDFRVPQQTESTLYRARGLNATGSRASEWTPSNIIATPSDGWWFQTLDGELSIQPDIADFDRIIPEQVLTVDPLPPRDAAVVVTSGPQAERINLTFRTLNRQDRIDLETMLATGGPWRIVNVLGQEWIVKRSGPTSPRLVRAMPTASESTGLRDFHMTEISFVEVEA